MAEVMRIYRRRLKQGFLRRAYRLAVVFSLFQKSLAPDETTDSLADLEDEVSDFSRIRCPLCKWQPDAASRWCCADCWHPEYFFGGCETVWNTFDTRGLCPGCGHQWRWTVCLRCSGWSLHEEWYAKEKD